MREFNTKTCLAGVAVAALLCGTASGQTWTEQGDAPALPPGQETQGSGPLTSIAGTAQGGDVDLYKITITNVRHYLRTPNRWARRYQSRMHAIMIRPR